MANRTGVLQNSVEQSPGVIRTLQISLLLATLAAAAAANNSQSDGPNSPVAHVHSPPASSYQPALIGFRCDGAHEITPEGDTIIESNRPIKLTLYGELFTTQTIVAFTSEFVAGDEDDNQNALANTVYDQTLPPPPGSPSTAPTTTTTSLSLSDAPTTLAADSPATSGGSGAASKDDDSNDNKETSNRRRRRALSRRSYDCTDFDRVTSYRLSDENIITPNVAQITITLPELDTSPSKYYYFCIKQLALVAPVAAPLRDGRAPISVTSSAGNNNQARRAPQPIVARRQTRLQANESLVWVHQGTERWLSLRVEPPILSIANDCVLIVLLLFLSAVTSGLNLGLMSLDMNELAVISSCGDPRERSYARTIAPLRKRGNYLLCSLLLGNVMVNATLTVILEEMTSGLVAVIGSTLAIVVLGEIVPQAFCARQGLAIGAKTIYLTYAFMLLTFPLSYPISWLLDTILGEEKGNVYDRERLMEFIRITGHHTQLDSDEVAIISGALKLKKIKVEQIMTRIEDVFMLPIECMLNRETIKRIIEKGYSRIPVYEFGDRKQIVALILAKDLALLDPDDQTPLASMLMYCKHPLIFIEDQATLDVALNEFKTGKSHMAVVRQIYDDGEVDKYYESIGVVTLEDVIEEVLQTEINDETDTLYDNRRKRRRKDAQVAHLLDELTTGHSTSTANSASQIVVHQAASETLLELPPPPQPPKQVGTDLAAQLSCVVPTTQASPASPNNSGGQDAHDCGATNSLRRLSN